MKACNDAGLSRLILRQEFPMPWNCQLLKGAPKLTSSAAEQHILVHGSQGREMPGQWRDLPGAGSSLTGDTFKTWVLPEQW